MRQIVLDTETTGLEHAQGHRIIEIGCVELVNRRLTGNHYHQYIQPNREVDEGAMAVHGITNEFLLDKPVFADIINDFLTFIGDSQLVIHNAPFDVGFLDSEIARFDSTLPLIEQRCKVLDTLTMARQKHPGQKNNLDALCKRYEVDNSQRDLHGALLDAEILADVYLVMTGGQRNLLFNGASSDDEGDGSYVEQIIRVDANRPRLSVVRADEGELSRHNKKLEAIDKASGGNCLWLKPV
ncbi:DNA polymerase III subunit epsilon [Agarilytica rhodophyticola]|uniref:DNA polymerase III subunit epsilon n=1 Tax=Agarilytica rhodophyticola TaxID=1737490 RepID=UPI000B342319|nr:DNA polymerase III subunit epsilon [Agarilytica rhodophyticola]